MRMCKKVIGLFCSFFRIIPFLAVNMSCECQNKFVVLVLTFDGHVIIPVTAATRLAQLTKLTLVSFVKLPRKKSF